MNNKCIIENFENKKILTIQFKTVLREDLYNSLTKRYDEYKRICKINEERYPMSFEEFIINIAGNAFDNKLRKLSKQ